ncbi:hypothetical protein J7384_00115 [Endozoicomonas sp. G2_1]|uniref:hypothetical protein n=1 Tax=Endozoicomonas sp. G2_1 TaxID=2821091 RepID=UPI001ADD153C|nr:hypothetical protein [Endozoicomonas sp. G2_1]MBO9488762.1 hypothetical protein [Endozoicomonas sp. G2_1]
MSAELTNKISNWFDKSGYPLEMYAYKALAKEGFICEKSPYYTDEQTKIAREIDIVAIKDLPDTSENYHSALQLLIECKKSEKPIVILSSEAQKVTRYNSIIGGFPINKAKNGLFLASLFACNELSENELAYKIGSFVELINEGYSLVQALNNSDHRWYKNLLGLANAYEYYDKQHDLDFKRNNSKKYYELTIPTLVIDAPLFIATMNNQGELDITEEKWGSVNIKTPWRKSNLTINIQVIKKTFLKEYLKEVIRFSSFITSYENVKNLDDNL